MTPRKKISPFIIVCIGIVALIILGRHAISIHAVPSFDEFVQSTDNAASSIKAPLGNISVEVASTSVDREKGLGGQTSLEAGKGMLFIFPSPDTYGFWMKDTYIPLDMIWIDANKKVAGIASDILPDTYPKVFSPPVPILYVLEVNAGAAKNFGIATGTQLVF